MQPPEPCPERINDSHVPEFEAKLAVKVALSVVYGLILVAGVLGNAATIRVCWALRTRGYLQPPVSRHLVSLACSDLLLLGLGLPVELVWGIWLPFAASPGAVACKLYCFVLEACSYSTLLHVATLSLERYTAVCHPLRPLSGPRTTTLFICLAWLASACVACPLLFTMGAEYPLNPADGWSSNCTGSQGLSSNVTMCTSLASRWTAFQASMFSASGVYLLVLASVAFMCRRMMLALQVTGVPEVRVRSGRGSGEAHMSRSGSSPEAKVARKQSIVFLGLIVGSLALCWMPNQILRIMAASIPKHNWTVSYFRTYITLLPIADTFFYLSSVANPILYSLSSKQFREAFVQVLRCHLTIEHANKARFLQVQLNSTKSSTNYKRPLIFTSLRRSFSSNVAKEKSFSTFQSESDPYCTTTSLTSASSKVELKAPETEVCANGLCESEI
ncbi:G-protein coupled receptor 39 [Spea bombifrons]|uniref:G-protein coupled receptor 39 n=1 Tax=Spea bombifrons TaxID=233779 RepID=UPI00234B57F4|nr:G-protein coupled receptor 39 [Spea bombifrons]